MGYDLFWRNLTEDHLDQLAEVGKQALEGVQDDANMSEYASVCYDAMRETMVYERASIHMMHAYCAELRAQGAEKLADAISKCEPPELEPNFLIKELRKVSPIPSGPPDHEYVAPFEAEFLAAAGEGAEVVHHTARPGLAAMDEADWTRLWTRFTNFLVGAAYCGDGVAVR
jgi:hypothetical protein